jgi:LuxR family transcriptional regulator, quorum-sensing system regulator BjaR1
VSETADFVKDSFDLITNFDGLRTLDQLRDSLTSHLARCGIEHFVICRVPPPGQQTLAPLFLVDRWPKEWLDYYDKQKFVRYDPITARLLSHCDPFFWSEVPVDRREQPMAYRIMAEATEFGMIEGLSIPIFDPSGFSGCISMSGPKLDMPAESQRALHMVSLFAHGTAERLHRVAARDAAETLTDREREVLRWIAVGKTYDDVGDILGISARTVEAHLRHAKAKLGTVNTTHTTVVALQQRAIRL